MGLLNRIASRAMSSIRGAGAGAAGGMDNMAMRMSAAPPTFSPQAQAFIQRLEQRVMELQQQPSLPPRLRQELNENVDLLRRIQAGDSTLS